MKRFAIYILFLFMIVRCGDAVEDFDGFLSIEIEQLMASSDSKTWLRTIKSVDGQEVGASCEDSLLFVFTRPISNITTENALLVAYNPYTCDLNGFCELYPNICNATQNVCEEDSAFCSELPVNLFFAGTWQVIEPPEEGETTDRVQINYPGDTTIVTITEITSKEMEFNYKKTSNGQEQTITEKFITEQ